MINLLPKDHINFLRASKQNLLLRRYLILLVLAAGLTATTFLYMDMTLRDQKQIAEQTEAENLAKAGEYNQVEIDATDLSKNINQAKLILSRRVDYSTVLTKLAKVLPTHVSIVSIKLDSKLFEGTKSLQLTAQNYQGILDTKKALEESQYFKSVKIDEYSSIEKGMLMASLSVVYNKTGFEL